MAAAAVQEEWDGEVLADAEAAVENAFTQISRWTDMAGCDKPVVCLSDREGRNFRKQLTEYKSHRHDKPVCYWQVVEEIEKYFRVERIPGLEADDVMGIMATSPKLTDRSVIVSLDKDLKTIPAMIFNPDKDKEPWRQTPGGAHRFWMYQTLIGDTTDGYGGCPGVGPIKAEAILNKPHNLIRKTRVLTKGKNKGKQEVKWVEGGPTDLWSSICAYYRKAGLTEEDAILQARLARILHRTDYNKEEGLIYLWHPTQSKRSPLKLPQ